MRNIRGKIKGKDWQNYKITIKCVGREICRGIELQQFELDSEQIDTDIKLGFTD